MDKYLIDTSSLISLARYYAPFDEEKILYTAIHKMFIDHKCVLLESVFNEAKNVAKGIITKTYVFLKDIPREKNISVIPPPLHIKIDNNWAVKLHNKIDNNWAVISQKAKLAAAEYETRKKKEIEKADFQLIFMAQNQKNCTIVSEESKKENDQKLFKKIPLICKDEEITCIRLPEMMKANGIHIEYKV